MKLNCYAVLPANVRYDRSLLPQAKLLYAEISAAVNFEGYCDEDVDYFAKAFDCDTRSIYRYLSQLIGGGYVKRDYSANHKRLYLPMGFEKRSLSSGLADKPSAGYSEEFLSYCQDFIKRFENGLDTTVDKSELYYPVIEERLKTFSKSELIKALDNRIAFIQNSEWFQQPANKPSAGDITLLIKDNSVLLKWLNMKQEAPVKMKPFKFD